MKRILAEAAVLDEGQILVKGQLDVIGGRGKESEWCSLLQHLKQMVEP